MEFVGHAGPPLHAPKITGFDLVFGAPGRDF
jgi:hypothetical protein